MVCSLLYKISSQYKCWKGIGLCHNPIWPIFTAQNGNVLYFMGCRRSQSVLWCTESSQEDYGQISEWQPRPHGHISSFEYLCADLNTVSIFNLQPTASLTLSRQGVLLLREASNHHFRLTKKGRKKWLRWLVVLKYPMFSKMSHMPIHIRLW